VARAALCGLKGVASYKNGWLVLCDKQPVFVYESLLRARSMPLPAVVNPQVRHGIWTDTVEFGNGKGKYKLVLLKDGPAAETAIAELHATEH
jgi:hypothetical protein